MVPKELIKIESILGSKLVPLGHLWSFSLASMPILYDTKTGNCIIKCNTGLNNDQTVRLKDIISVTDELELIDKALPTRSKLEALWVQSEYNQNSTSLIPYVEKETRAKKPKDIPKTLQDLFVQICWSNDAERLRHIYYVPMHREFTTSRGIRGGDHYSRVVCGLKHTDELKQLCLHQGDAYNWIELTGEWFKELPQLKTGKYGGGNYVASWSNIDGHPVQHIEATWGKDIVKVNFEKQAIKLETEFEQPEGELPKSLDNWRKWASSSEGQRLLLTCPKATKNLKQEYTDPLVIEVDLS